MIINCSVHQNSPVRFFCEGSFLCQICKENFHSYQDRYKNYSDILDLNHLVNKLQKKSVEDKRRLADHLSKNKQKFVIAKTLHDSIMQIQATKISINSQLQKLCRQNIKQIKQNNFTTHPQLKQFYEVYKDSLQFIKQLEDFKFNISKNPKQTLQNIMKFECDKVINAIDKVQLQYVNQLILPKLTFQPGSFKLQNYSLPFKVPPNKYDVMTLKPQKNMDKSTKRAGRLQVSMRPLVEPMLHFFNPVQGKLNVINIQKLTWLTIELRHVLAIFGKSFRFHEKFIYIGGHKKDGTKEKEIFQFNMLDDIVHSRVVSCMNKGRSSFGACQINQKQIFVAGGFGPKNVMLRECEIFNIQTQLCREVAPMNFPGASFALTMFNNSLIRVGGVCPNKDHKVVSSLIQKYDFRSGNWVLITPIFPALQKDQVLFHNYCGAVQINPNQVFVFGGLDDQVRGTNTSFTILQDLTNEYDRFSYRICNINVNRLPFAEGHWENEVLVDGNVLICLQNIDSHKNSSQLVQNYRKVLATSGQDWAEYIPSLPVEQKSAKKQLNFLSKIIKK